MKNRYELRGDVTVIFLKRRSGEILEMLIDSADLAIVQQHPGTWSVWKSKRSKSYYCSGSVKTANGKLKFVWFHRWLTKASNEFVVDHFDSNGLNNRRDNLRIISRGENVQNLKGANFNNRSTKTLGVTKEKGRNKFRARIFVDGKNKHLGTFDTAADAELVVKSARALYKPFSKEAAL